MTDTHQEAIERVAAYHECLPFQLSEVISKTPRVYIPRLAETYLEGEVNFAEQVVIAERKLEELGDAVKNAEAHELLAQGAAREAERKLEEALHLLQTVPMEYSGTLYEGHPLVVWFCKRDALLSELGGKQ